MLLHVVLAVVLFSLAGPGRGKCFVLFSSAAEDGLARTPPLGWRNWYITWGNTNQTFMEHMAKGMVLKRNIPTGERDEKNGVSLLELGYTFFGLDDGYQSCAKCPDGSKNNCFHNETGWPVVNETKFPNMAGMVETIRSLGLKPGWYHNNCICMEKQNQYWKGRSHFKGDVAATISYGFDNVKLDGCGAFKDTSLWYDLFKSRSGTEDGKNRFVIENCHNGKNPHVVLDRLGGKDDVHCPYHMYRTGGDNRPDWDILYNNLQKVRTFQDDDYPLSRPGCWAYPDMLMVGYMPTFEEDRAHFGAWAVTSSPLQMTHDLLDDDLARRVWPLVANRMALAINQDWAGHPGRLVAEKTGRDYHKAMLQVWNKPLSQESFAVFVWNANIKYTDGHKDSISINLKRCGAVSGTLYDVYNVWSEDTIQSLAYTDDTEWAVDVQGRDSVFLLFRPHSSVQNLALE